jgi:DNA modification methylase
MTVRFLLGDCRDRLKELADESVHCVVTSPPYWGLRNYGVATQIGLEPSFHDYIEQMVAVFREVRRVLRADGTLWLNLGDAFENKQLLGMPWRLAFALQEEGWWLRQDIIWSKKNLMPESVTDRCTKSHEYLFLLTKSARYYFDNEAIKEPAIYAGHVKTTNGAAGMDAGYDGHRTRAGFTRGVTVPAMRNKRSVWEIASAPFADAHFATFPPALIEPCILAGTSARGCCAKCGAPWVREVKKTRTFQSGSGRAGNMPTGKNDANLQGGGETLDIRLGPCVATETTGWSPSCKCLAAVVPSTVLDPFGGAGTTGLVADRLQRDVILIELNPDYVAMAERRIAGDAPLLAKL